MGRFAEKVAIVTGGSSGIGAAIVARLSAEGATVMIADLQPPAETNDAISFIKTDVSSAADVAALVEATVQKWGRIDILVNNAGMGALAETPDMDEDVWDKVFAINTKAIYLFCKHTIPVMRAQGHGRIVQCSSILGLLPYRWRGAYTASKYALEGLSLTLRMELEGSGVQVSLIEPGPIESRFTANALTHIRQSIDLENSVHAGEYRRQLARLDGTGPVNRHKLGPEAVYKVLTHALTARRARPHYLVTKPAKQGALLKRWLPADLFYRLMRSLD